MELTVPVDLAAAYDTVECRAGVLLRFTEESQSGQVGESNLPAVDASPFATLAEESHLNSSLA